MRKAILLGFTFGIFGLCIYLQADPPKKPSEAVSLRLHLIDADTGKNITGIVRIYRVGDDKPLPLSNLYDRLRGLNKNAALAGWYVVPSAGGEIVLPRAKVRVEAVSGIETALTTQELDLTKDLPEAVKIKVATFMRPEESNLVAGNTHLHLMNLTADDAEDYLKQIPAADRLKVLFLSYLERVKADADYITNRYPIGDLKQFNATGVLVNNGEEHRHNFGPGGQGYGHVMFLNIKQLVKPVSIGPGITGGGNDDLPLQPGVENARKQGGTVIWCHNMFGFEDIPNAMAGRIDALNVFDGSRTGNFEDGYYRYLNVGMRLPISTGTDWFLYDFARVYAKVEGKLTIQSWLDAVKAGRCQATNSPLLTLTVDGKDIGEVINLDNAKTVRVEISAIGRHDFQKLELIQNGKVIQTEMGKAKNGVYSARIVREVRLNEPAWFAARIDSTAKNELDRQLYAHTSPVYVDFAGQRVFDIETARNLQKQMEEARDEIKSRGKFSSDMARDKLLGIYDDTAMEIVKRINQRGK